MILTLLFMVSYSCHNVISTSRLSGGSGVGVMPKRFMYQQR